MATVTGTGRYGLSIRKDPGLSSDRVATVPDGFQAAVVAGPVAKDGADWYQVKAPDVAGWASGAYLTLAAAQASAPSVAAPSSSSPNPLATPLSGLLSQLNRDSNYDANGSGIFVEARLKPAVDHLSSSKIATGLLRKAAPAYLRLTVAHFPATSEGGEFSTLGHSIKVADVMLQENLDVQSTVISHELQHAGDILVDHAAPDTSQDCVNLEVRAFRTQEQVWLELTKPAPPQTKMESELDQLSHVVDSPSFAQQLAKLYAGECSAYTGSTR
ncbi:MAG: SH3 domain-containing protein [Chloroflexota bacterium]